MTSSNESKRVWLITGCSSGLGRALATRVLAHGDRCVVTARNLASIEPIVAPYPDRAIAVALDVADPAARENAVHVAETRFGRIDVLVNNAGHGYNAAIEEGEEEVVRRMFEANFFGLAGMIRCVLPGMRARGYGHIVNLSSIGGLVGNPGTGYYCATKFAVAGLSESLAAEAGHLGIRVTIIEPGPFRTDFQGRSITIPKHTIDAYASTAGARREQLRQSNGKQAGDPDRAADAIIRVVESDNPPLHLLLGKNGLSRAREKLAQHLESIKQWEVTSASADFPQ